MSDFELRHVPPNPTIEYANNVMVPFGTTRIVSIGGGSTIDVGKWVAKKYGLKHMAIPTTAGTGSEVTRYVVLTVDGKKKTFSDPRFIPTSYILDPLNLVTLPKLQTLSTGLDALSQCLESIWSKNATAESLVLATAGLELIMNNLRGSLERPKDLRARMNMLIGANMSGRAIDITKTNVCHAISYPLTDWYGIPHGLACGMSLAYFAEKAGFHIKPMLNKRAWPRYKIDRMRVAKEAIKSAKLKDCPFKITEFDIVKALS